MKIHQFLEHYGIQSNPFAVEDAQTDTVFKSGCIDTTYHPAWQKVFGDPQDPSTSIVFGEKGAGKTAMRLQIVDHIARYNRENPTQQVYVIEYDDFNPYLDRFREHQIGRSRRPDRTLKRWMLWDHMDAILMIGVTSLIDRILSTRNSMATPGCDISDSSVAKLDKNQARDLLLLAACYDESTTETFKSRWAALRKKLNVWSLQSWGAFSIGVVTSVVLVAVIASLLIGRGDLVGPWWLYLIAFIAGWMPWLIKATRAVWKAHRIYRNVKVSNHERIPLARTLMTFPMSELSSQPLPMHPRTDDRYAMLNKFNGILRSLDVTGIIVIVDRVDEPHLINGSPELMRLLLWPMLDNKFLKQSGIGVKLLLPIELQQFVERENKEFYQRARLDKQNMIPSLQWTSEALYDVASARVQAVSNGEAPSLQDMFDESISKQRIFEAFRQLRVPRHLFKFLYRLLVAHCNNYTDQDPSYKISSQTFESTLAVYLREQDAFDRGLGAG
ncbi:hypothetical protein ACYFX5_22735 [Bremerella sp. T1]|uniref:hypothetical protein n=1 Tax=Bremerella sp. TYQ1 TaxID=3119568 RepID=UPI001CCA39EB|nr:hypothetical protein [Bremerella volcania]UBM35851.1 hypothetical protein LA756_24680 [Bremerella volcania]